MKTTAFVLALFVAATTSLTAQADPIRAFVNKYKELEEAENINLGGFVLTLAAGFTDDEEAAQLLKKVSHLRILTIDQADLVSPTDLLGLRQSLQAKDFEDLMYIRDGLDHIDILVRETPKAITDVVLLIREPESFTLISLEGWLRYEDLRELNIDINGMSHLSGLPELRP